MQLLSVSKYHLPPNEAYVTGARLLWVEGIELCRLY